MLLAMPVLRCSHGAVLGAGQGVIVGAGQVAVWCAQGSVVWWLLLVLVWRRSQGAGQEVRVLSVAGGSCLARQSGCSFDCCGCLFGI